MKNILSLFNIKIKNKILLNKKIFFFIVIFSPLLLISCSLQKSNNLYEQSSNNYVFINSINLTNLRLNLLKADKQLIPKLIRNNDGSSFYKYIKKPGEGEITLEEIKKRVLLGSDFYNNDREEIINLLIKVNELKINNKLDYINSGALGLWMPNENSIIIDYRVIEMGSPTFLDVLSHEVIHVAQSCFSGSRTKTPKRIGLPLEYSKDLNLNLSHNLYSKKSVEVMNLEREAFTYSKVKGVALKLLNDFCE